jgi:hypothetical protein
VSPAVQYQQRIKEKLMAASPADIEAAVLRLLAAAGSGRTVNPTDAARALASGSNWHVLMPAVRRAAVGLALAGRLVIYRKGKPVDPNDFRGVYRLGLPRQD